MIRVLYIGARASRRLPRCAWNPDLFPVWLHQRAIESLGIRLEFGLAQHLANYRSIAKCDVVCIDSRALCGSEPIAPMRSLAMLDALARKVRVVWFDNRDASGSTQFEVLPYVHRYCKKQLLRDRSRYSIHMARSHPPDGIWSPEASPTTGRPSLEHPEAQAQLLDSHEDKLMLSWNYGLADYWPSKLLIKTRALVRRRITRWLAEDDSRERTILLSARFGTHYHSRLVAEHRLRMAQAAEHLLGVGTTKRVPAKVYASELRTALAVLSPFGFGEICLRDFEALISGAALIKPSMDHLETWPDVFHRDVTYLPLPWRSEEWGMKLSEYLMDRQRLQEVGNAGRRLYESYWDRESADRFATRFRTIVT